MELAPVWSYSLCRTHFTLIPSEENMLIHIDDRTVKATWISPSNQEWLLQPEAALKVWGPSKENHLYPLTSSIFRLESSAALTSMKPELQCWRWLGDTQISQAQASAVTSPQPPPPPTHRPCLRAPTTFKSLSSSIEANRFVYYYSKQQNDCFWD